MGFLTTWMGSSRSTVTAESGMQHAFAAGDVTSFPVKQGGLATQQADVVAEAIAGDFGCEVDAASLDPILRGGSGPALSLCICRSTSPGDCRETSTATDEAPWGATSRARWSLS